MYKKPAIPFKGTKTQENELREFILQEKDVPGAFDAGAAEGAGDLRIPAD